MDLNAEAQVNLSLAQWNAVLTALAEQPLRLMDVIRSQLAPVIQRQQQGNLNAGLQSRANSLDQGAAQSMANDGMQGWPESVKQ